MDDDDDDDDDGDQTYQALRRNDETVTEVTCIFPFSSASGLASALDGNTQVQTLDLHIGSSAPTHLEEYGRLRSYIKQAKSLCTIRYSFSGPGQKVGEWIDAAAASADVTEIEVTSWNLEVGVHQDVSTALVGLLRTTLSIKRMKLGLGDHIGVVIEGLRSNRTLESFSAECVSFGTIRSILDALRAHPSICRIELGLNGGAMSTEITPLSVMASLFALLETSSILTEVILHGFGFDAVGMQELLNGLQCNHTIMKLALHYCYFTSEAEDAFVSYMQESNGRAVGGLQHLLMHFCKAQGIDDQSSNKFAVDMLKRPRSSGLTSATFACATFTRLWEALEQDTAPESRSLSSLHLNETYASNFEAAVRHIPNLTYLRTLEWHLQDEFRNYQSLLRSFRANGSLYSVVFRHHQRLALCNPKEERLVEAWGERNRRLPELLKKCGAKVSNENSIGQEPDEGSTNDNDPCPPPTSFVGRSLSTNLFAVALQTPRMALHHCFHGITAMGDSLGSDRASDIRLLANNEEVNDEA